MSVEACLPLELQRPTTAITPIRVGLSGAGVYRVEADGQTFVLKVSNAREPLADWRRKADIQELAASAGLAPRVVHRDETQRAILSAFIVDRSFPALFGTPTTRDRALELLGAALRRVHDLPLPPAAVPQAPRELLASIWAGLATTFAVPAFVGDVVDRVLAEHPPASDRALVLSHNDVNPTNLVYDGQQVLLLDWDTAAPNDPYYDLAAIAVFLRMDDATCRALLAIHDGEPVAVVPPRFTYNRRLVAVLCGTLFLHLARYGGHVGSRSETLDSTTPLSELYTQMRAGALDVASASGQWAFGLALLKTGTSIT